MSKTNTATATDGFEGGPPRATSVPLTWPVRHDGKLYEQIGIRRLTAGEVAAFNEKMKAEPDRVYRWPLFDCPEELLDLLDDDDADAVNEAVIAFLPRRFRDGPEPERTRPTGADTAP